MKKDNSIISSSIKAMMIGCILILTAQLPGKAQHNIIHNKRIASLQVVAGNRLAQHAYHPNWAAMPSNIDFDDMTHDYHRYTYKNHPLRCRLAGIGRNL